MAPRDSEMRSAVPWMALGPILVVAVMLTSYVAGYVCLGESIYRVAHHADYDEPYTVRGYRAEWQAKAFLPLGILESLIYETPVSLQWPEGELTCRSGFNTRDPVLP